VSRSKDCYLSDIAKTAGWGAEIGEAAGAGDGRAVQGWEVVAGEDLRGCRAPSHPRRVEAATKRGCAPTRQRESTGAVLVVPVDGARVRCWSFPLMAHGWAEESWGKGQEA